jgi:hypothetical protein
MRASVATSSATPMPSPLSSRTPPRPTLRSRLSDHTGSPRMCISKTTKSAGFRSAQGFIAAAHGGAPAAFSVHTMGTRSLATKRRASEAIKVSSYGEGETGGKKKKKRNRFALSRSSSHSRSLFFFFSWTFFDLVLLLSSKPQQHLRPSPSTPRPRRPSSPPSRSLPRPVRSPSSSVSGNWKGARSSRAERREKKRKRERKKRKKDSLSHPFDRYEKNQTNLKKKTQNTKQQSPPPSRTSRA